MPRGVPNKPRASGATIEEGSLMAIRNRPTHDDKWPQFSRVLVPREGKHINYPNEKIHDYINEGYEVLSEDVLDTRNPNLVLMGILKSIKDQEDEIRLAPLKRVEDPNGRMQPIGHGITQTITQGTPVDPDNLTAPTPEAGELFETDDLV